MTRWNLSATGTPDDTSAACTASSTRVLNSRVFGLRTVTVTRGMATPEKNGPRGWRSLVAAALQDAVFGARLQWLRFGWYALAVAATLAAQRQRRADRHEDPAACLVEALADAPQPRADAVGHAGDEHLGDDLDRSESAGHHDELQPQAALRVDELRQERGE